MSPILIRGLLRRHRQRLALIGAIVALTAMVAAHHSAMSMGEMHDDMGAGAVVEMCLGVFAAVGAAVVAVALGIIELGRWRRALLFAPVSVAAAAVPAARGRDGPAVRRLLCVCRC